MLQPKRLKWRKPFQRSFEGPATRGTKLEFGSFGLVALDGNYVTARQIEATRIAITRYMKRNGQVWIRIFPDLPITKKPLEVRQGKGKGSIDHYVAVVKTGRIIFEVDGVSEEIAREALRLGMHKLPIRCKIISKEAE